MKFMPKQWLLLMQRIVSAFVVDTFKISVVMAIVTGKLLVFIYLLGISTTLMADKSAVRFTVAINAKSELRLELTHAPLDQALNEIANKTDTLIHYSALPEGLFSVSCTQPSVTEILHCLLDNKADLIVRYAHPLSKAEQQNLPVEIWVLATPFDVTLSADRSPSTLIDSAANTQAFYWNDIGKLRAAATENEPQHRVDAIAMLATQEQQASDQAIHGVLTSALSDQNAEVRAQAVSGLVKKGGDEASEVLQSALQDNDVSVRLMAVDNAGENSALLQQALNDSDETVRAYAAIKLDAISAQ